MIVAAITSALFHRLRTVIQLRSSLTRNLYRISSAFTLDASSSSVHTINPSLFSHFHVDCSFVDVSHGRESVDLSGSKGLPEDLMKNVMILSSNSDKKGVCSVYLIGTAHISEDSCREVKDVISFLKPEAVFLELCSSRIFILSPKKLQVPALRETLLALRRKQNIFGVVYSRFLRKMGNQLGVLPGYEFRVAYDEAKKYGGKVILGDRPIHITLQRTWTRMPFKQKVAMIFSLFIQAAFLPSSENLKKMIKELEDPNALSDVVENMGKAYPSFMETLVHERDQYMSAKLVSVAREYGTVVAVVGKGHLEGIKRHWEKPVKMDDLLQIPPRKPFGNKVLPYVGAAAAFAFIFSKICSTLCT